LAEPLDYRISWRGLQSRVYRLVPRTVPGLESLRARISGQAAEIALSAAEPLSARRGAWVALKGRPNQPLASVHLRASFLPAPLALRCVKDGECETGFFSSQDGNFQFDVEAVDGRRDPAPVAYALKAVPDEPPKVELLSPLRPVQASPASVLPVAYAARDDAGLSRVTLIVRVPGAGEREIALQSLGPKAPKDFIGDFPWELAGLPVGAKVEFRVKAVDDGMTGGFALIENTGSTDVVLVAATSEAAGMVELHETVMGDGSGNIYMLNTDHLFLYIAPGADMTVKDERAAYNADSMSTPILLNGQLVTNGRRYLGKLASVTA